MEMQINPIASAKLLIKKKKKKKKVIVIIYLNKQRCEHPN